MVFLLLRSLISLKFNQEVDPFSQLSLPSGSCSQQTCQLTGLGQATKVLQSRWQYSYAFALNGSNREQESELMKIKHKHLIDFSSAYAQLTQLCRSIVQFKLQGNQSTEPLASSSASCSVEKDRGRGDPSLQLVIQSSRVRLLLEGS